MIPVYATTIPGLEELAAREVRELCGSHGQARGPGIFFSASIEGAMRYLAHAQAVCRVLLWPSFFEAHESLERTRAAMREERPVEKFKGLLAERFRAECERFGDHSFRSSEVAGAIGGLVKEGCDCTVDLRSPQASVYCLIDGTFGVIGFDPAGFDLSKRYYKVFATPRAPRGPLGYALGRAAAVPGKSLLDPSCMAGVIPIEMAIWASGQSVHRYDRDSFLCVRNRALEPHARDAFEARKPFEIDLYAYDGFMPNVVAAKKNAKIAGVQKAIRFGRSEAEWLDVKFKKGEIDAAAMHSPPQASLAQLFYQLEYVLARRCTIALTGEKDVIVKASAGYGFEVISSRAVGRGNQLDLVVLARGKP